MWTACPCRDPAGVLLDHSKWSPHSRRIVLWSNPRQQPGRLDCRKWRCTGDWSPSSARWRNHHLSGSDDASRTSLAWVQNSIPSKYYTNHQSNQPIRSRKLIYLVDVLERGVRWPWWCHLPSSTKFPRVGRDNSHPGNWIPFPCNSLEISKPEIHKTKLSNFSYEKKKHSSGHSPCSARWRIAVQQAVGPLVLVSHKSASGHNWNKFNTLHSIGSTIIHS